MSRQFKVVAVSGSVQHPSRTRVLLQALVEGLARQLPIEVHWVELARVGPQFAGVLRREALPAAVQADLAAIESADLLVAATPVYRASYTGLFKHLFGFFQALGLPVGVYASETDFNHYRVSSPLVLERIERAVESAVLSLVLDARRNDASAA